MVDPTKFSATPVRTMSTTPLPNGAPQQGATAQEAQPSSAAQAKPASATKPTDAPARRAANKNAPNYSTTPFWMGMVLSIVWVGVVAFVMTSAGAAQTFAGQPLVNWAIAISAIISPIAMVWMIAAYLQRAADVQSVTEPLRRQLAMITGESGAAEVRVRRFNQAIKEQLELLRSTRSASDEELTAIIERINANKADLEAFEQHSLYQVKEIQDVIRRSMNHIEQLMEDKFAMLRILDNKLVQSGDDVARQTEGMKDTIASLLHEVESNALIVASSVERAMQDSKKLSDTARSQETSLLSAAETASETLSELSGRIDSNIAHFLSRAGMAREEAEKLAGALDTQTRSLDEFANILPSRVTEAEAVLRGVADRLYASEQLAREQAVHLSEKLEEQMNAMQGLLDRFASRLNEIDGGLQQRRTDLDGLVVRISGASNDLAQQMDTSIQTLGKRADGVLEKFASANNEARESTDAIARQLAETAAKYESATKHLTGVSETNASQLRAISHEIGEQLAQFENLHKASQQAGQDVQIRASAAAQNMQQVLERLLATRDATQSIGETLTEKLRAAVEQNEHVIARINEAARMSVHALGVATESLGRQEGEITAQTQTAESTLRATMVQLQKQAQESQDAIRAQNEALVSMLADMHDRLDKSDVRIQAFADQAAVPVQSVVDKIEESTKRGRDSLASYSGDMQAQIERLQSFNGAIGAMGMDVSRMTENTLHAIEDLNKRFVAVRAAQDETARIAVDNFNSMADRLQKEIGTLGAKAGEAANTLQQAATKVGEQTQSMRLEAQDAGAKIEAVTTALQNEAVTLRETLEKQSAFINAELTRAGSQFVEIGQTLKDRTDSAYAMLDRVAGHYNEITRTATDDFEARATKLDITASEATGKVQSLSASIEAQLSMINAGTTQIESHASRITATGARTIDRLEELNARFTVAQTTAIDGTDRVAVKLEDAVKTFKDQHQGLNDAAELSVTMIQKAGSAFGEQASRMLDTTHQVEDSIRSLNAATTSFAEQSTQVRSTMEQHNARLISNLKESVEQIDTTSARLQQAAATAILNADQTNARYDNLASNAARQIEGSTKDLINMADSTQGALSALSASVTQQVASLNLMSEQIAEQHRVLTETNTNHRTQLLDLFEKLGAAHGEASDVAERTITRMNDTLEKIQKHIGELSDHSQTALANISDAGSGFGVQSAMLLTNAKQAEEQARSAIEVTEALQRQAKDLNEALNKETERTGALLTDLVGRLASSSGEMMSINGTANGALSDLQLGIAKQTKALNETMDSIVARQETLTSALNTQRETLDALIARLTSAQDETASAAGRAAQALTGSTGEITAKIDGLDAKAKTTLATLQDASESFTREAQSIATQAGEAERQTQKLMDTAQTAHKQVAEVCENLRGEAERTESALGKTVEKVQGNITELREGSVRTETALSNLGSTITQQTTAINANLSDISEKQSSLGSALDVQREMLGTMVTRLTLAQDETAAAAERSAARLSDCTAQIARQMESIDTQAQNAVAAVRAAGTGLGDEAAHVAEHTKNAENQVRDMLKSTTAMREEARNVRELMQKETNQMIEQVRTVMAQLDATVNQVKQQNGKIAGEMDKSVLDFSTIAKTASEALAKEADRLASVSEKAKAQIDDVNERVREGTRLIGDASEMSMSHGRGLMETAEKATTQLVSLIATMNDSDRTTREIMERATSRLTDTRTTLEKELQTIADLSQRAVEQVMGAGSALAIQSDALRANLSASESALTQAADLVREESSQLPALMGRSTKEIEKTAGALKSQSLEISDAMLKTTDRCISATGAIRDTMMDEVRHMANVAETADRTLHQFNEALKTQLAAIKAGTGELSQEQKEMIENATQTITQLSAASDRLSQLRTETQTVSGKLAHDFEMIEARADSTAKRLTGAGDNLSKQVEQLIAMTERAEGKMVGASTSFREQLERVRGGVQAQIDDINRGLMQITAQLDRTGTSLRTALASTVVDVEKIAGRFDQTSKETANQLTDRTARMRVATEEVAKLLGGFGDQIDTLLSRLGNASEGIKRHEGDLVGHMQQAFSHLGTVAERLNSTRALTESVSEAAVSKLTDVSKAFDKQMRHLAEGGQTVSEIIKTVSQTYADQVQRVNSSVTGSQEQILTMTKSIDEMQQRTDRMRVTLKLQAEDLMESLEKVVGQLSGAGDAMSDAVDGSLQQRAINSLKRL